MLHQKRFCLFLAIALALCALPSFAKQASAQEKNFVMAGYDGDSMQHDWTTNLFFQRMQEETGVSFSFQQFTEYEAWTAQKEKYLTGGDLPDVLFKAELTSLETLTLYENGKLIDVAPLLEEYAPHLYALLEENPSWRKAITLPDGAIAALPAINLIRAQNAMWINQTWLENLKLDLPTDAASFKAVLKAFKTQDPNRNGKKDEIPLAFLGSWDLKYLAHAYGLVANDYNIYADASGKVQFMPASDTFREFLLWVSGLYDEGLLDQSGFTTADTLRTITDEKAAAIYGIVMGPTPTVFLPAAQGEQYVLLQPLVYGGKQIYRDFVGPVTRGTFAITSACQDPAALLSWVDKLYTEEGARLALAGKEGVEYAFDESGNWSWLGNQQTLADVVKNVTICDSGSIPWYNPVDFQLQYAQEAPAQVVANMKRLGEIAVLPYPVVTLTADQEAQIAPLQSEIGRYVDESIARFVLGEVPLNDETWQTYKEMLDEMGLKGFVDFWQDVLNAYSK